MTVAVVAGAKFDDVAFDTALGTGNGYVVGTTPVVELLRVDVNAHSARLMGLKYSRHAISDPPRGARPPDQYVRVTMLVEGGPWHQRLWKEGTAQTVTVLLNKPGDFVAWQPGISHEWTPKGTATMVTLSYERVAA